MTHHDIPALLMRTVHGSDWDLKEHFPTYPLDAPGMPRPGYDFMYMASLFGDRSNGDGKPAPVPTSDGYLSALYAIALYCEWFTLAVKLKNMSYNVRFIPGHAWGDEVALGPRRHHRVMVIGKMPGHEERARGLNFVGASGEVLKAALADIGFDDVPDWYVTNVLRFGHPIPHRDNVVPTSWIKDCEPLLHQELRIVRPDFILCLGSEAGKALLGMQGNVTRATGRVFDYRIDLRRTEDDTAQPHRTKVMVCIHPAAVVRSPDLMPRLNQSLRMFVRLICGEPVGSIEPDIKHTVVSTQAELQREVDAAIAETAHGGAIAVDCEWHGEHPGEPGAWLRTIQFSHKPKYACCVVLRHCGGEPAFSPGPEAALHELRRLFASSEFEDRSVRAVGQFHRADLPWLKHFGLDLSEQFSVPSSLLDGWELTKTMGGFDTGAAAHAVRETDDFKLEVQAARYTGAPRYDAALQEWKKAYCAANKIGAEDLDGYGQCPNEILHPYACYDVDVTRRLFDVYNGVGDAPGLLDCDEYGNNCRMAFWISMRASPACAEMERHGLLVDMGRASSLISGYKATRDTKVAELRELIGWPSFKVSSAPDCRELLFGPKYRGQYNSDGTPRKASPDGATLCNLLPVKSTSKRVRFSWEELVARREADSYTASTDKESLGILAHQHPDKPAAGLLRDIRFIEQLLRTSLRPPAADKAGNELVGPDGEKIYTKGLLSYRCSDNRIRTTIYQTLETGRYSSARPNLQALAKRREADYRRIQGAGYKFPMRSIFVASPGYVLIEADYIGAELACMAWFSGDPQMIEHVRRSQLPESHLDYYDIHSMVAVTAFRLNCPATKAGLESIGMLHLRVAAKNVVFGYAYGRGAAAIQRQCKEEGVDITLEGAQSIINTLVDMYPGLPRYFDTCRRRVYEPGWVCNTFGRFRRFSPSTDRKVQGEQERQAMNFGIQSAVADAVSRALDHLYYRRDEFGLNYRIVLQIHDAVLLECPYSEVEAVYDIAIPRCMTELVPIRPSSLDGIARPGAGPYFLATDRECMLRWGEKMTKADCEMVGIPTRFGRGKK